VCASAPLCEAHFYKQAIKQQTAGALTLQNFSRSRKLRVSFSFRVFTDFEVPTNHEPEKFAFSFAGNVFFEPFPSK